MSFDGNGIYVQPVGTKAVTNTIIDSALYNTLIEDIAVALTKCMLRDGQSGMLADFRAGGFKVSDVAPGTLAGDAVTIGQLLQLTVGKAKELNGTQQTVPIVGAPASMSMFAEAPYTPGSYQANALGTGDTNIAGISFNANGYQMKFGVRSDGFMLAGGGNRTGYSFYSDTSNNFTAAGDVIAFSDPRLKENMALIESPLASVMKLNGMRFTWKHGIPHILAKGGKEDIGFMSDNVATVLPEAVFRSIALDGESYNMVAYDKVIPLLVEAMKEQQDMIEALREQVQTLNNVVGLDRL